VIEEVGTGSIMPGQILEYKTGGKVGQNSTGGVAGLPLIALETHTPDTITYPTTGAIDIPYDDGETVYCAYCQAGDVINGWLKDGESVKKGIDFLIRDGAGRFASCGTGISVGTSNPIGVPDETLNNSSGGTAVRCRIRII